MNGLESGLPPEGRVSFDNPDDASTAYMSACLRPLFKSMGRYDRTCFGIGTRAARSGSFAVSDDMMSLPVWA